MDHQELLRNYENALSNAEVDDQVFWYEESYLVWRACKGWMPSWKLGCMFSTKLGSMSVKLC